MCCLIYKFLLILTQKMQISFLKILPENALKFVSKKMRICVKNFAQLQRCSRFLRYRSYSSYNLAGSEKDMDIIKVGILGVAAVLMAIPLRKEKQEYSMFLSMAVCICIFIYIITKVQIVLEFVEKLEGMIAIDSTYIGLVIKMVGITYAAEFAVNVCRDSGYGAIAGQIENFAKMSILVVSLPVLMAFIDTVGSLL